MQAEATSAAVSRNNQALRRAQFLVGALALLYGLLWLAGSSVDLGLGNYLPLHTFMEMAAIVVAMLAFGIAWNAYVAARPGNIALIGAVLFGTGLLDFGHMLGYHGMPDFVTPSSPQKGISFWLAARYLAAFGLFAIAWRPWQPLLSARRRHWLLALVIAYVVLCYWVALFHHERLPDFFVSGQGLTPLKIALEYGLVTLYGVAAWRFWQQARNGATHNATDLFSAAAIAALSELCFTLYASVSDIFNTAGHIYKIVSYGFIFRAIFIDSVRQPFEALSSALNKEKRWSAEQHSFVRTLDMLDEAVIELLPDGRIANANSGWWRLSGTPPVAGHPLAENVHEEDRAAFKHCLRDLLDGEKSEFHGRFRFLGEARPEQWMEGRFVAEHDENGRIVGVRGVLRDITKSYLQERHIAHMALHDALTGLPNRVLLEDRIHKAIQLAKRKQDHVAVCFIDLDHFKNINDAYGHKIGDALLQRLAQALTKNLRDGDTLARWGGDEFVALLPDLDCADDARQVAQKLVGVMRQTFELDDHLPLNATFSMGISVFPHDGDSVDNLLAQADRAMFYAKSQGRNNFQMFADMSLKGLGKKELYIQSRLAQAIRDGLIEVWFQPLVTIDSTPEVPHLIGVEALARWHDADFGWISPSSFIPMAENLGLIGELGQHVRHQALVQFKDWRAAFPHLHLSLNISKRQLFAPDFLDTLLADAAKNKIPPAALTLEITESVALMDVEFAEERLRQLSVAGFTLSIDDFGTGYASLSQLHDLPVGELKIDISFVRRIDTPEGLRMVQAIVNLAKALHLRTVAEGVEDAATATTLHTLGVDILQGYYFGRPCNAAEFVAQPLFAAQASASQSPALEGFAPPPLPATSPLT
jgi:diguanylate cyclase (GGDEF)-like protein/PAS domain S-box-containing protein